MDYIKKSLKLENVCYDIRGPVLDEATRLEEEGYNIYKLNIGSSFNIIISLFMTIIVINNF